MVGLCSESEGKVEWEGKVRSFPGIGVDIGKTEHEKPVRNASRWAEIGTGHLENSRQVAGYDLNKPDRSTREEKNIEIKGKGYQREQNHLWLTL